MQTVVRETARQRSGAIDAVRVIGIVAVVAGHTWDNEIVRHGIYSWHVPLFFFLTGYLWTPVRPLRVEFQKRWSSILLPYLVWLGIIGLMFEGVQIRQGTFDPSSIVRLLSGGNQIGQPFSAFWFMTALFVSALLLRLLQKMPTWIPWAVAIVALAVTQYAGQLVASIPLSAGIAVPCLVFILAGSVFRKYRQRITKPLPLGLVMIAVGLASSFSGLSSPLDLKQADFGTPGLSVIVSMILCAGLLLIAEPLFSIMGDRSNRIVTVLARGGTMVVLTHAVVFWVLGTGPNGSWVAFTLALVLPWAAALLAERTALARYLLGHPRQ